MFIKQDFMTDTIEKEKYKVIVTRREDGSILNRDVRYYNYEDIPLGEKNDRKQARR